MKKIPYSSQSAKKEDWNVFITNYKGYTVIENEKTSEYDSDYRSFHEINEMILQELFKDSFEVSIGFISAFHNHFDLGTNRSRNQRLEKELNSLKEIKIFKLQGRCKNGKIEEFFMISTLPKFNENLLEFMKSLGRKFYQESFLYKPANTHLVQKFNIKSESSEEIGELNQESLSHALSVWMDVQEFELSGYYRNYRGFVGAILRDHVHHALTGKSLGNVGVKL